ncbi:S-phase kinase-associated protein [Trema orientale]|uniref:SKP1-like protein n=1 Tax=Trema orientale TaxID=63057 RepID=A0A2P5FNG6_TREOI|nr:S-phase kinase-associated protein [Trema orientale]
MSSSSSSTTTTTTRRLVILKASDGVTFYVEEVAAIKLGLIKKMVERGGCDVKNLIPLPNVNSQVLSMVLEWCKKHANDDNEDEDQDKKGNNNSDDDVKKLGDHKESSMEKLRAEKKRKDDLKKWDKEFIKDMDVDTLYDLLTAANYLNGNELVDLLAQKTASMMVGKSPQEIREMFKIENDFAPEEEEEQQKADSAWSLLP